MSVTRQASSFLAVGLAATIVDYSVMIFCRAHFGVDPALAALAGYCCGGAASYHLNRRHTFETERTHLEAGWRFAVVTGVGFALTGALMALFADSLQFPYLFARVLVTGIVFFWNFMAHRFWTFDARLA